MEFILTCVGIASITSALMKVIEAVDSPAKTKKDRATAPTVTRPGYVRNH